MNTLSILAKSKNNLLTLKAITKKDKLHPLIEEKEWKTTLISETKTCYLYVNKESPDYNFSSLYDYFLVFGSNEKKGWNIDIKSFISKNLSEELIIQAISEGVLFGSHKVITYKK